MEGLAKIVQELRSWLLLATALC